MTRLVNVGQMTLRGLEERAHSEWAPSEANVSDIPSRVDSVSGRFTEEERRGWDGHGGEKSVG